MKKLGIAIAVLVIAGLFGVITGGTIRTVEREEARIVAETLLAEEAATRLELYHEWALDFEGRHEMVDVVGVLEKRLSAPRERGLVIFIRTVSIGASPHFQALFDLMLGELLDVSVDYLVSLGFSPEVVFIAASDIPVPIEYINTIIILDIEAREYAINYEIRATEPELMMWVGRGT